MRRELFIHFAFWFSFFVFISIFRGYLTLNSWPLWFGGLVGTLLPNVDHLIYVFFLNPQELTSQRVNFLLKRKEISRVFTLLSETRPERKNLIFHTFIFQLIFFAVAVFILTSSNSIFARGLVLAFMLHLSIDQIIDLKSMENLNNWGELPLNVLSGKKPALYIVVSILVLVVLSFFV